MIILDSNTKLQAYLGAAVATNQSVVNVFFVDVTSSTSTPGLTAVNTNSTTTVDILQAPAASTQRLIKNIQMFNADTVSVSAFFQTFNSTAKLLFVSNTQVGDNICYEDGAGWSILDTNGNYRSNMFAPGRLIRAPQVLTSGTSYTIPTGCMAIQIELVGGGGGGGGAAQASASAAFGAGGAAGSYLTAYIYNPQGSAITYAIGAGGTAGSNTGGTGGGGGVTSFTCNGIIYSSGTSGGGTGQGAGTTISAVIGGAGATPTSGDINTVGQMGAWSIRYSATVGNSGAGGTSPFGAGGVGLNTEANGNDATALGYGGGGGGACCLGTTARTGGVGGGGCIIVKEYY